MSRTSVAARDSASAASSTSWQIRKHVEKRIDQRRLGAGLVGVAGDLRPQIVGFGRLDRQQATPAPRAAVAAAIRHRASAQRAAACSAPVVSSTPHLAVASASVTWPARRSCWDRAISESGRRKGFHRALFVHVQRRGDQARTPGPIGGRRAHHQVRPRVFRRQPEQGQRGIVRQPRVGGKDDERSVLEPGRPAPSRLRQHRAQRIGGQRHEAGQPRFARQQRDGSAPRPRSTAPPGRARAAGRRARRRVRRETSRACRRRSPREMPPAAGRSQISKRDCPRTSKSISHDCARIVNNGSAGCAGRRRTCQRIAAPVARSNARPPATR